jgi:small subunit ribosomal protein S20
LLEGLLANLRSAKKRIRQNRTRRLRNRMVRTRVRGSVRLARTPASADAPGRESAAREAIRQLDKAASKGVIHRKNAARRKSRLLRSLRKTTATS